LLHKQQTSRQRKKPSYRLRRIESPRRKLTRKLSRRLRKKLKRQPNKKPKMRLRKPESRKSLKKKLLRNKPSLLYPSEKLRFQVRLKTGRFQRISYLNQA